MCLDELSFEIRVEGRTTKGILSGHIMRLVPLFIIKTHNQMNHRMFAQVAKTNYAPLVEKRSMSKVFIMFA